MDGIGIRDKRKVEGQGVRTDGTGSMGCCWSVVDSGPMPGRPPSITPVRMSQSVRPVVSRFALQARGCDAKINNGWLRAVCEAIDALSA